MTVCVLCLQQEEEMVKMSSSQGLVSDEVKLAFTDGAQKVDVEMVTIG
jgi:hypothetical protein